MRRIILEVTQLGEIIPWEPKGFVQEGEPSTEVLSEPIRMVLDARGPDVQAIGPEDTGSATGERGGPQGYCQCAACLEARSGIDPEDNGGGGLELHYAVSPPDCSVCGAYHPEVERCPPKVLEDNGGATGEDAQGGMGASRG